VPQEGKSCCDGARTWPSSPGAPAACSAGIIRGRKRPRKVYRIAPGELSLVAELRGHERQAAEELEQRTTPRRRRSPWACLMTPAELEELERKVTELEKRALVSTACSTLSDAHDRPSSRCAVNVHPAYGNSGKTVVPRRARAMIS